jgi:hypothetical protein
MKERPSPLPTSRGSGANGSAEDRALRAAGCRRRASHRTSVLTKVSRSSEAVGGPQPSGGLGLVVDGPESTRIGRQVWPDRRLQDVRQLRRGQLLIEQGGRLAHVRRCGGDHAVESELVGGLSDAAAGGVLVDIRAERA